MGKHMRDSRVAGHRWRIIGWGAAACLLLVPLVAMQLTEEVRWNAFDFVFAAGLILGVGIGFELAVRASRNNAWRAGAAVALANAFLILWANGAVGILGSERDAINTVFTGIVVLALVGAAVARFRASGMAVAMFVAAGAQLAAALYGLTIDVRGAVVSGLFVTLWGVAGWLFRRAARGPSV